MPRLSIIIPVLGSLDRPLPPAEPSTESHNGPATPYAARLETTLVSVLENRPPDCEIIVVHNAPYDDPYDLAAEVRFLPVDSRQGLVDSLNHAIQASQGTFVHVLSAGLEATDGWTEAALAHFQDGRVASVAPVVVDALDPRRIHAAGLNYSCRRGRIIGRDIQQSIPPASIGDQAASIEVLGPLVQAAFFRRSVLELIGGLSTEVGDALVDTDVSLALRFAGYRSVLEPRSIVMTIEGFESSPPPGFRHGLAAERLFWRAAPILGWGKSLIAYPWAVLADFVRSLPRPASLAMLVGRVLGACQMGSHRAYHQWLIELRQTVAVQSRADRATRVRIDGAHLIAPPSLSVPAGASVESTI